MDDISFHSKQVLFDDLLDHLRRNGFSIGIDSYLRLQKVLTRVSGNCTPDELKTLLCPILANDKKQQEFFYDAFDAYFGITKTHEALQESLPQLPPPVEQKVEPVSARRWPYIIVGLLLTIIIAGASYYRERQLQINQGIGHQPNPTTTPIPIPDFVRTIVAYQPVPELLQPVRWLAFIIPSLFWLLYEWYLYNRRKLLLNKLSSDYQPHIFPFRPNIPLPTIFTSERFYNLARRLRRRQITELNLLDINATVGTTIKFLGYPVLRFKRASKLPEYLVLIERKTYRDNLSRFFDEFIKALEREGIQIARYYYEGDPRVCFKPFPLPVKTRLSLDEAGTTQSEQGVSLREILNKHEDCRLLIFGSGEGLVNPLTGVMEEWTSLFSSLKERALLTYIPPGEWSFRELALASQFLLVPSTLDGLHALIDYYEIGETISLQRWIHKAPVPTPLEFDSPDVVSQLREHLGENTFRWLCACAIYPSLQWNLTAYLGGLPYLRANLADEQNILRLISLPWFRSGSMPEPLRQLLINELPPELYDETRAAIISILNEPEQVGTPITDVSSPLNVAIPRMSPVLSKFSLRRMRLIRPISRIFRDYIFVRFLESKPNTLLNLALPRSLGKVFYPRGNTALRMKLSLRILTTLLVSVMLWMAAPIIVRAFKTEPTLTVQSMTIPEYPQSPPTGSTSPTLSPSITVSPTATITPTITPRSQQPLAAVPTPESDQTPQLIPTPAPSQPAVSPTPEGSKTPPLSEGKPPVLSLDIAPTCPQIKITSDNLPVFTVQNRLSYSLRAEVIGGKILQSPRYIWSLQYNGLPASDSQGRVIAGQGTSAVDIIWVENTRNPSELIAKVVVTGYNVICATEASWTLQTITPKANGGCGCITCGHTTCCPNPGYCVDCDCGTICCLNP